MSPSKSLQLNSNTDNSSSSSLSSSKPQLIGGLTGIREPIETTQQFFNWFSKIEEEMEKGQEDIYRSYLVSVQGYRQNCDDVLSTLNSISELLHDLQTNYIFVEEKTKSLQMACEKLLEEQVNIFFNYSFLQFCCLDFCSSFFFLFFLFSLFFLVFIYAKYLNQIST